MPIYNYKCECGYEEEVLILNRNTEVVCPECNGRLMERQFSPEGQRFNLVYDNKSDMCDWSGNTSR